MWPGDRCWVKSDATENKLAPEKSDKLVGPFTYSRFKEEQDRSVTD